MACHIDHVGENGENGEPPQGIVQSRAKKLTKNNQKDDLIEVQNGL